MIRSEAFANLALSSTSRIPTNLMPTEAEAYRAAKRSASSRGRAIVLMAALAWLPVAAVVVIIRSFA